MALLAGRLMLQYGAETEKVEHAVSNIGHALGCDNLISVITHNSIILTVTSGVEYRTKIVKVTRQGINYDVISQVGRLSYLAAGAHMSPQDVRETLMGIEASMQSYGTLTTVVTVSLACGAFSQLFGGDHTVFLFVFAAAFFGMNTRLFLIRRQFNALFIPMVSAFVATSVASLGTLVLPHPDIVYASGILFLVPGVQLINAAEDIIKGHFVVGFTRGFMGILISLSIAFGTVFGLLFSKALL